MVRGPEKIPQGLSPVGIAVTLVYGNVVAPLGEELFFRGVLFRSIRDRHGFWVGALASGVAFGLIHYIPGSTLDALLLMTVMVFTGIGFAYIYERRGTIVVIKEGEPSRNQVVLLSPQGAFSEVYNKTHIPPGEAYDLPGGTYPVFASPLGQMAGMICHDGNYTDVARKLTQSGAQLISAPFKEFPGFGEQLWQNTTFRAVENRTAIVTTGATSVAAIADPYGRLVALDVNKAGSEVVLIGDVSLGSGKGTLYTALGDLLGWAALAGLVALTVYQSVEGRLAKKEAKRKLANETSGS